MRQAVQNTDLEGETGSRESSRKAPSTDRPTHSPGPATCFPSGSNPFFQDNQAPGALQLPS